MNRFVSFVYKESLHILRDRRTMLILLGMPVIQIVLFGFALSTEVKNVRMAVYDPSRDVSTENIVNRFAANDYFLFGTYLDTPDEIDGIFRRNKADIALVFENNFGENLRRTGKASLQLVVDGSDPNTATVITGYARNIIASHVSELNRAGGAFIGIDTDVKLLYNPQMKSAYNFVPGVMGLILMLICAMMTSVSIVREKETGTMEVLLVSPAKPIGIIFSKTIPYFVLSAINLATILILSVWMLGIPIAGNFALLAGVSLLFIFVALGIGILISSLVRTQVAAMLASGLALMMPVIVLSGMIFPTESMAWPLRWLSALIPARWYISAVKKIMIEGAGISFVVKEFAILAAMGTVIIVASLKKFKNRLE